MPDANTSISDFLNATAAKQPTPGGGSVTALTGALAAAIGEMSLNYSVGRKGLEAFQGELKPALSELTNARAVMLQLMLEDQYAYETLTALRKLPADSPERLDKMPVAQLACIRVPEAIAATAVLILEKCDHVVNFINPWLLSDLAVSADLAMATIRCAIYNVRVNLKDITDPEDRRSVETTMGQLLDRGRILIQSVTPRIWDRVAQEG